MKRPVLPLFFVLAAGLLTTGCAAEALTGSIVEQAAQGSAGQPAGPIDAMVQAQESLEEPAFGDRVAPEHDAMLAGQQWKVTGGQWKPGADVSIVLRGPAGDEPGTAQTVHVDDQGRYAAALSIPAGTAGGPHTIAVTNLADPTDTATAEVTVLGG